MELYRVPRREVSVRILVDDGRILDGMLFTAENAAAGLPDAVLRHLDDCDEDFVPLMCNGDAFLLNKAGIVWVEVPGSAAERSVSVSFSLAGGIDLVGQLAIVMPQERSRVVDYLNAVGRFLPVYGEGHVKLVQRRFIVTVRSGEEAEGSVVRPQPVTRKQGSR